MKNRLLLFFVFCFGITHAQQQDSTAFTAESYLSMVRENHPLVTQANLIYEVANAERLKAGGAFDPKLFNETNQKYFDDKTYFKLQDAGLEIPAWFGLKAKTGYEQNSGIFLNDQNTVPTAGLWYADVSITLGKGLFIDERRAMLRQAKLMQEAATFEVEWELNKLYQRALDNYWEWYRSYSVLQLYQSGAALAFRRFNIVKQNALIGEKPYIDTLEAYIQYQTRLLNAQNAQAEYNHASNTLETFLWIDGLVPLELAETTYPVYTDTLSSLTLEQDWLENHPQLNFYSLKINQIEVQQRLNRERLKPQVDLNYKFLNEPVAGQDFFSEYAPTNYEWGLSASFPIFLRKERGEIRKTDAKLQETNLAVEFKQRELQNKVQAFSLEISLLQQQLEETRKVVDNYQALLNAEITKFQNGESSLFLINQREIKYLESSEKLLKLQAKLNQTIAKQRSTAGVLD